MERQNLNISQWLWWVERDSVLIAYWDANSAIFTSPSEVKDVHLLYIQRPDKFLVSGEAPERDGFTGTDEYLGVSLADGKMTDADMLNQECEIPEQFHEALINRVIANGYERQVETIQLSQHFHMKYEVGLKQAKAYSYRGRDGSLITRAPVDF
tara:strand:- start:1380 stop:1841 length:462 start_codon:yes stop_codon:yes gene_type:complete